jgi:predicted aspartyl protease
MGTFYVQCEVSNIRLPKKAVSLPRVLVDSRSEHTWIPEPILKTIGVRVEKKDTEFLMANGQTITRSIGFAILSVDGFRTVDEVVFGQPGDLTILGARTLEGFGATVDPRRRRLIAAGPYPAAGNQGLENHPRFLRRVTKARRDLRAGGGVRLEDFEL